MKFEVKDGLWLFVVVVVALSMLQFGRCISKEKPRFGDSVIVERVRDSVIIKNGSMIVRYEKPNMAVVDSLRNQVKLGDSILSGQIVKLSQIKAEIKDYTPKLDSLGLAIALEKDENYLRLPTLIQVEDTAKKWISVSVMADEKPFLINSKIVSEVEKSEYLVFDNFWREEKKVFYNQKNPYLPNTGIEHTVIRKKKKGQWVKFGIAIGAGVLGGAILNNQLK